MVKTIRKMSRGLLVLAAVVCLFCFSGTAQAATTNAVTAAKTVSGGKWVKTKTGRKYRYKNGTYAKSTWLKIENSIYRFDSKGICQTGWFTVSNKKYYAAKSTGKLYVKRWLSTSGGKYYLQASGVCAMNKWVKVNGKYYYLQKTGKMTVSKMILTGGKYYYVNKSGVRVTSTWVKSGGKKYYFDASGVRAKSIWIKYKNNYYYVGSDGAMAVNTWVGDYYVGSNGARMKNCTVDGYKLDANGKRTIKTFKGKYIFVGDSRMVGMQISKSPADTLYIAQKGMGYNWLNSTAGPLLKKYLNANPNVKVVLALGVNDLGNIQSYLTYYRGLIKKYPKTEFYILSVNPVDEAKEAIYGYYVKNARITSFNKKLRSAFGASAYINSYSYLKAEGVDTVDGLHYTVEVYRKLYDYIVNAIK